MLWLGELHIAQHGHNGLTADDVLQGASSLRDALTISRVRVRFVVPSREIIQAPRESFVISKRLHCSLKILRVPEQHVSLALRNPYRLQKAVNCLRKHLVELSRLDGVVFRKLTPTVNHLEKTNSASNYLFVKLVGGNHGYAFELQRDTMLLYA